jgi:hypothetical protein
MIRAYDLAAHRYVGAPRRGLATLCRVDAVIAWCGFLGAWLLVAGSVYQAAVELGDEELEREDLEHLRSDVEHGADGAPPRIPAWWWLFPPVLYVKHRRRDKVMRTLMLARLTLEQTELVLDFVNKATGWVLVGLGGFLIASKETWELREHYEWPIWPFWLLIVCMAGLCLANAAVRMQRSQDIIEQRRAAQS